MIDIALPEFHFQPASIHSDEIAHYCTLGNMYSGPRHSLYCQRKHSKDHLVNQFAVPSAAMRTANAFFTNCNQTGMLPQITAYTIVLNCYKE
jgi:hypothetical protein